MSSIRHILLAFLLLLASAPLAAAGRQDTATQDQAPKATVASLSKQLDDLKAELNDADQKSDSGTLGDLATRAQDLQQQAEQLLAGLTPQRDALQTQLNVLGPAPQKGAPPEPPELSAQRRQLDKAKTAVDGDLKQVALLIQSSGRLASQARQLRRDQFQAQLTARMPSPLGTRFWNDPAHNLPADLDKLRALAGNVADAVAEAWLPPNRAGFLGWLAASLLLLTVGHRLLVRGLLYLTSSRVPPGRLRRSSMTLAVALSLMACYGFAAQFLYLALDRHDSLSDDLSQLGRHLVDLVFFASWLAGLGRALLATVRPSWRLPPLSNHAAQHLRGLPWLLAGAVVLLGLIDNVNSAIGASLSATVITQALLALTISGLFGLGLLRLGQARRAAAREAAAEHAAEQEKSPPPPAPRPLWIGLVLASTWITVVLTWLCTFTGYIAFAYFLAREILWESMIVATLYLFLHLVDDLFDTLLSPQSPTGKRLQDSFGFAPHVLEQSSTILSGTLRALLFLLALSAVLTQYGTDPVELLLSSTHFYADFKLGDLSIAPRNIVNAVLVFTAGLVIVRLFKGWLTEQLLPKTHLDSGLQNSLLTLFGYVGGVVAFMLALAALHVNLQSIAWVASALSVGIGFGLQAIVQNFISGLILLAERPVRVGDWVSIGGVEGDVLRINVRATEIRQGDRSTVIVPNSQFITSNVRNVTLNHATGRVQVRLPMPLDTDVLKVRELLLGAMRDHPTTLDTPSPVVQLDTIDGGSLFFLATAYVRNPRDAGNVRSDLLFEILKRFAEADLALSSPQSMLIRSLDAPAQHRDGGDDGRSPPAGASN